MSTATTLTPASIEAFRSWLSERGRAENTIRAYASDLRELLRWSTEPVSHHSLQQSTALWLNETRASVAPSTTSRRLASLKMYAKWAKIPDFMEDYLPPTPARPTPHPLPEGIEGVFRMCEGAKDDQERALFAMQGLLGMRVSEARSIRPEHFDLNEMTVTVRGKGDVTRLIPVSDRAWAQLKSAYERARVMLGEPLVTMSDRQARYAITECGERLGFKRRISSHDLRATCATKMYEQTLDLRATQELLGHASSSTTERYTLVSMKSMREGLAFA